MNVRKGGKKVGWKPVVRVGSRHDMSDNNENQELKKLEKEKIKQKILQNVIGKKGKRMMVCRG